MIYEDIRLLAVERFKVLDLDAESEFQELVQIASDICNTPIALITLLGKDTQWLKVKKGTDVKEMPRDTSFCTHAIERDEVMVVSDAKADVRFSDNPIVIGEPNIRFYAGTPLITPEGLCIGTLCVFDVKPHQLNKQQKLMLKMLGKQAFSLMEFRISVELLEKNRIEVEHQKEVIKKAEITLRSQSASLLHIAHLQAHQFRAPLTTIIGMMDLIKAEQYQAPEKYFNLLEDAVNNLDKQICEIVSNIEEAGFFDDCEPGYLKVS